MLTLPPSDGLPPEVLGAPYHQYQNPDGTVWTAFHHTAQGYLLRFPGLADFALNEDASHVDVWPAEGVTEETVRSLYLNQVAPLALSKQGVLVLHASAVDIDGLAAAFVGRSGRGKSTLAASFAVDGHAFLSDDGLALERLDDGFLCRPSHPSIRLWSDSLATIVGDTAITAPALSYTSKARVLVGRQIAHCATPSRLGCIYFLGEGTATVPTITAVPGSEALTQLVLHSFLLDTTDRSLLGRHFDAVTRLAALPAFWRLDYPRAYDALPHVRAAVMAHLREQQQSATR